MRNRRRWKRRFQKNDAELSVTPFMNLMVILVPFLLIMLVFGKISILELRLISTWSGGILTNSAASKIFSPTLKTSCTRFFLASMIAKDEASSDTKVPIRFKGTLLLGFGASFVSSFK